MEIKILGSGCAKCNQLEKVAREAVASLGIEASIEHVDDFAQIASYGVMTTPALVVDGEVRLAGRVPSAADLARLLESGTGTASSGGCGCGGGCC